MGRKTKTYNSRDSLVVTHPTTSRPACGLNAVNTRVDALVQYSEVVMAGAYITLSEPDQPTRPVIWVVSCVHGPLAICVDKQHLGQNMTRIGRQKATTRGCRLSRRKKEHATLGEDTDVLMFPHGMDETDTSTIILHLEQGHQWRRPSWIPLICDWPAVLPVTDVAPRNCGTSCHYSISKPAGRQPVNGSSSASSSSTTVDGAPGQAWRRSEPGQQVKSLQRNSQRDDPAEPERAPLVPLVTGNGEEQPESSAVDQQPFGPHSTAWSPSHDDLTSLPSTNGWPTTQSPLITSRRCRDPQTTSPTGLLYCRRMIPWMLWARVRLRPGNLWDAHQTLMCVYYCEPGDPHWPDFYFHNSDCILGPLSTAKVQYTCLRLAVRRS
ncbi:hypothetical protein GB937_005700 [Aspergillus fischeri]|nr:hypothetical protein GB937_005700 [Aspergillus fischeri]